MTTRTTLTYTPIEWHTLVALVRRSDGPTLTEPDLPVRISNTVGRAWLAGLREVAIELLAVDAAVFCALRAGLPDAEVLAAIAEAERIVREHQRRRAPR